MSAAAQAVRRALEARNVPVLVDTTGAPLRAAEDTHFDAASRMLPQFRTWNPSLIPADVEVLYEQMPIMARSRDLVRNDGIAAGAIQTITDNVVGHAGLRLASKPDYEALGWTKEQADTWARDVERRYRSWAESTDSDAAMQLNHASLTNLAFRSSLTDGDLIALAKWLPDRPGAKWATCAQIIDPERLSNPYGGLNTQYMRNGIEIDDNGRPLAYNIRKMAPGAMFGYIGWLGTWEKIPARTSWGRLNVIHLHDMMRTGQSRGLPIFTAVMSHFKMIGKYKEAELQAAIANGLIAAFIKTSMSPESAAEALGGSTNIINPMSTSPVSVNGQVTGYVQDRNRWDARLQGGSIIQLPPGDELQSFTPSRPATAFGNFVQAVLREIAAGINLPYELLAKDFTQTNYSSARAALLEAWRYFMSRRAWLAAYWSQPWYELWLEEAVNRGEVDAPGFYENRFAYCRAKWIGAGRGWVDPVKEAQAMTLRVEGMVSTLADECAEQGKDWEEVLLQRKREQDFIEENEIQVGPPGTPTIATAPDDQDTPGGEDAPAQGGNGNNGGAKAAGVRA